MKTILTEEAKKMIGVHAEDTFPNECCGFLFGKEGNERVISEAVKVTNSKEGDQRRRFAIAPADYMKAEQYALENDWTLLGVYHSHPQHPAIPSEYDRKQAMPFFSYFIVSVIDGKTAHIRSWKLDDNRRFEEEDMVLETGKIGQS